MRNWKNTKEKMPSPGIKVIAFYRNSAGKGRTIFAEWIPDKFREEDNWDMDPWSLDPVYDEDTDKYYWPEGWYECIENWEELSHVKLESKIEVTHWMELPKYPDV